jgi:hypothetical protein
MRKPLKLAAISSLALTLASFTLSAQPPEHPPGFGGPHRPPRGLADVLNHYDANGDGTLDDQERAVLHQEVDAAKIEHPNFRADRPRPGGRPFGPPKEILDQYDINKDGQLDETEHAAVKQDIDSGKLQPPGGDGPPPFGPPPSAAQILEQNDLDNDGKLDEKELDAFLKSHRPPPPGGRGGPRGRGGRGSVDGPRPQAPDQP